LSLSATATDCHRRNNPHTKCNNSAIVTIVTSRVVTIVAQYLQYKHRLYREITYNMNNCHRLSVCQIGNRPLAGLSLGDNRRGAPILPYCGRWVIRFRGLNFPIYLFSPETGPHEATSLHLAPTPHPTPWGGSPTPRRTLGSRF
jgi:hypothetical protein